MNTGIAIETCEEAVALPGDELVQTGSTAKRFFDIAMSAVGLLTLFPLFLAIALVIKFQDGGPVIFKGRRVGKDGRLFDLFKFRSMVVDAGRKGGGITVKNDCRVTKFGRFLRSSKLDELPQLYNVLRGDMSLVGPRPEDPRYMEFYSDEQLVLFACRPGITSPASLEYRSEEQLLGRDDWLECYREEILPHKLSIELRYLRRRSFWSDIKVILQTFRRL